MAALRPMSDWLSTALTSSRKLPCCPKSCGNSIKIKAIPLFSSPSCRSRCHPDLCPSPVAVTTWRGGCKRGILHHPPPSSTVKYAFVFVLIFPRCNLFLPPFIFYNIRPSLNFTGPKNKCSSHFKACVDVVVSSSLSPRDEKFQRD